MVLVGNPFGTPISNGDAAATQLSVIRGILRTQLRMLFPGELDVANPNAYG
jgi:hypothetical protein